MGSGTQRDEGLDRDRPAHARRTPGGPEHNPIRELQRTLGNAALARLLSPERSGGAPSRGLAVQRTLDGMGTVEALKANAQAWNTFLLLAAVDRTRLQGEVVDGVDHPLAPYFPLAKANGQPIFDAWFAANAAAIAATAPGRIDIGGQNVGKYQYPSLLRFRWFGRPGPKGYPTGRATTIAVFGLNLHRGPVYSGLGHAWCKIGDNLVFELDPALVAAPGGPIAALEGHAAASADAGVSAKANNANCV